MTSPIRPPSRQGPGRRLALLSGLAVAVGLLLPASHRADRFPDDPVDKFRQALRLEQNKSIRYKSRLEDQPGALRRALDFRKTNLGSAAANLKSLSDLSRALLLIDWPTAPRNEDELKIETRFDREARQIEKVIREDMTRRFVKGVRQVINSGNTSRQVAVADLVGETAASASELPDERLVLYEGLAPLADNLAKLTTNPNARVRAAAARALGQFPSKPEEVARAMRSLLADQSSPASVREAAADALVNLSQVVSSSQPIRGSEPGVSSRATRRNRQLFGLDTVASVIAAITPVAGLGLGDSSLKVRQQCAAALRQSAGTLAFEVRLLMPFSPAETFDPPVERTWTREETNRVLERRRGLLKNEQALRPAVLAFSKLSKELLGAARDSSPAVRLEARRTLEELAEARRYIIDLREAVPRDRLEGGGKDDGKDRDRDPDLDGEENGRGKGKGGKGKAMDKDDETRLPAPAVSGGAILRTSAQQRVAGGPPRLPSPRPFAASALRQKKDRDEDLNDDKGKGKDAKKDKKDAGGNKEDLDIKPRPEKNGKEKDKEEDLLGGLLKSVADPLAQSGTTDPDPRSRRAAMEALEASGKIAERYIPQLIRATKDRDLFVRWIAARTLGRLAPAQPTDVVPALVCLLGDDDLDPKTAAARALGQYGPAARSAIPALASRVVRGDTDFRVAAMKALESIGSESASALPNLGRALGDTDPRVRAEAARVIGRFGVRARAYAPYLERLTNDPDSDVRKAASASLLDVAE